MLHWSYFIKWRNFIASYSQLPVIENFQPQLSSARQCVAEIIPGYMYFARKWVKIDCVERFHTVPIICESQATSYFPPNTVHIFLNQTIYDNIKFIQYTNSTIMANRNYCKESWFHVGDKCFMIMPLEGDECVSINETVLSLLEQPKWRYIIQLFAILDPNDQTNLFLCRRNITLESLASLPGLHQCDDFTFIAEHHVCDGEADCPDASDEQHRDDVCTFNNTSSNFSCYSMCTYDT